jgi:hypothetical protein
VQYNNVEVICFFEKSGLDVEPVKLDGGIIKEDKGDLNGLFRGGFAASAGQ